MFKQLGDKIKSGESMSREERDSWHRRVGDSNEYTIEREGGKGLLRTIMDWWYAVCDEHQRERED